MKNSTVSILSLLGGMVIDSALALAFTPKTGAEMRSLVRNFVTDEIKKLRKGCHEGDAECECGCDKE